VAAGVCAAAAVARPAIAAARVSAGGAHATCVRRDAAAIDAIRATDLTWHIVYLFFELSTKDAREFNGNIILDVSDEPSRRAPADLPPGRFVADSPLEEAVYCELVSEMKFPES
jgi:hypothetical protein